MEVYAKKTRRKPVIELEMKFPKDYPMNPPFVRILRPRFQFLTGTVMRYIQLTCVAVAGRKRTLFLLLFL